MTALVGVALVGMTCSASAMQLTTQSRFDAAEWEAYKQANVVGVPNPMGTNVGGDNAGNATVIPGLPYNDSGNTCGYLNDYTPTCHSSNASDVVYRYTPSANTCVTISLCGSSYDTGLSVHQSFVPNSIACIDDYCGLQSQLDNVALTGGVTYYIVIDGYSTGCGAYVMSVVECPPPPECQPCPPYAYQENEVDCYTDYWDGYNAGCNATPPSYSYTECHDHFICGTTGVYLYQGLTYRDTDWYVITVPAVNALTVSVTCQVPVALGFLNGDYCTSGIYYFFTGVNNPCETLSTGPMNLPAGTYIIFVSTNGWNFSWPCGSEYVVSVSGTNCGPSGAENTTWGNVRNLFN
jgi:hypothetical protein